jgi:predicted Rossmann fold nucleotide-binding protein DprA/Smf involved in DNA uptake
MDSELAIDEIARLTTLPMHVLQADLTMLEIRGLISRAAGKYAKKR